MKVLVRGPALTRTGYGEHCRFVLRCLRQCEDLDIHLLPVNWGQSSWVWENSEELPEGVSLGDNKLDADGNTIPALQQIDHRIQQP